MTHNRQTHSSFPLTPITSAMGATGMICLCSVLVLLLATPRTLAAGTTEMISRTLQSVAMVITFDENRQPLAIGSAFAVSRDGKLVTNYHVVEGASSAVVKFANRDEKFDVVSVVHKDPNRDLIVIKVQTDTTPLPLGDDELAKIGDRIYAVGNPEGLEGTVSEGIISGFRKTGGDFRLMQITAPISPGSSGGPVLTVDGKVIGVASASLIIGQNLNFGIPSTQVKRLLESPVINKPLSRGSFPVAETGVEPSGTKASDLVP